MKFGPDKGELRMRRRSYGPLRWSLAAPAPGTVARCRRSDLALIAILAFLVLGVFVVAEARYTGSSASNSANASLQIKPEARFPATRQIGQGSAYLSKDLKSKHHAS